MRILRAAEGARPMLLGFNSSEAAGQCVAAIIGSGIIPVAIEFMDKPAIARLRGLRQGRLSARRRGAADHRGGGLRGGDRPTCCADIVEIAKPFDPKVIERQPERRAERARSGRAARRPSAPSAASPTTTAWTAPSRSASCREVLAPIAQICDRHGLQGRQHLPCRRRQPASADPLRRQRRRRRRERAEQAGAEILKLCVAVGGCLTGEHGVGIEKRDLMRVQFTRDRPRRCRCGSRPCSTRNGC